MAKRWWIVVATMLVCAATSRAASPEYFKADSVSVARGALLTFNGEVEKKLARGLNLSAEAEVRMKEMTNFRPGVNHLKLIEVGTKLSYKICDYVKVGGGYFYRAYLKDGKESTGWENYWEHRHIVVVEAVASYKVSNWKFSLRVRPELTIRTDSICELEKVRNFCELRTRLQVEYDFASKPFEIFAYTEMFNTLNAIDPNETLNEVYRLNWEKNPGYSVPWSGQYVNNVRAAVGFSYRFDKRNSIKVYYRFDYDIGRDIHLNKNYANNFKEFTVTRENEFSHMLGIGYAYSF
ncbi:MAG: DUF2490 domain-containing protein [Rikenellaceae bacterium]|nr:DUF2490 domain-containing protein [Rikenellaceae bacterium]